MQSYLDAITRLGAIEQETAAAISELQSLQTTFELEYTLLTAQREERKKLAGNADAELEAKGAALEKMEQDRAALQKVIQQIEKQRALAQAREEKRLQEEKQLQEKQEQEKQAQEELKQTEPEQKESEKKEPATAQEKSSSPLYSAADLARLQAQSFAQRKGNLAWPTQGKLVNRFGEQRQGSITWDGLRILAANGTDVRAVHGGRVMYADSLRGQGLLLVLDHGDGYMSLYAHNDVLLREIGEWVQPGDTIARVGNSGGEKESGLYFEIRQNGDPINPLPWLIKN
jgi:septal ring factor EnvC (AmiA/AmiB activator)